MQEVFRDRNGLTFTDREGTLNAYKYTAFCNASGRWQASARASRVDNFGFNMDSIGFYKDARDAAFVAQTFATEYDHEDVRRMMDNGTLRQVMNEFKQTVDIPKWQFICHSPLVADIVAQRAFTGRAYSAMDALRFAVKFRGAKAPRANHASFAADECRRQFKESDRRMTDIACSILG